MQSYWLIVPLTVYLKLAYSEMTFFLVIVSGEGIILSILSLLWATHPQATLENIKPGPNNSKTLFFGTLDFTLSLAVQITYLVALL